MIIPNIHDVIKNSKLQSLVAINRWSNICAVFAPLDFLQLPDTTNISMSGLDFVKAGYCVVLSKCLQLMQKEQPSTQLSPIICHVSVILTSNINSENCL